MGLDRSINILVVDDDQAMIAVIRKLLSDLGFLNVAEAADGNAALARLGSGRFGLVISDWNMEPMDGIALLGAIRGDARLKDLPVVLATAESGPARRSEARRSGASAYLAKPFDGADLKATLEAVFGEG